MIVSFADPAQGHHGGVYQAAGWIYTGTTNGADKAYFRVHGRAVHRRTLGSKYGQGGQSLPWLRANVDPQAETIETPEKHRYVLPLDAGARAPAESRRQPYPKRAPDGGTTGDHPAAGGSTPTRALHA